MLIISLALYWPYLYRYNIGTWFDWLKNKKRASYLRSSLTNYPRCLDT